MVMHYTPRLFVNKRVSHSNLSRNKALPQGSKCFEK
jgi:hypothetical protein